MSKQPFLAMIIPMGAAPGYPERPVDPGYGVDEGGGQGGRPDYPNQGLPGRPGRPDYPSQGPVRPGRPIDPGFGWGGGERPGHPIAPGGGRPVDPSWGVEEGGPDGGLPVGPAQPWVPPSGEELPPPPEEIADQVVLAIWRPEAQTWTVKTAPPAHPSQGLPGRPDYPAPRR